MFYMHECATMATYMDGFLQSADMLPYAKEEGTLKKLFPMDLGKTVAVRVKEGKANKDEALRLEDAEIDHEHLFSAISTQYVERDREKSGWC
jgi:hypothetical protein